MRKKNPLPVVLILSISLFLSACAGNTETAAWQAGGTAPYPVILTDQAGRSVTIDSEPQRIVSGYYISTSILLALGLKDRLVGIEAKADKRPIYRLAAPELIALPDVGTAKQFDPERCAALEPDLVILPKKLKDAAETLDTLGIRVLVIDPEDETRLMDAVRLTGKAVNREKKAAEIKENISSVITVLSAGTASASRPRVCITGNSSPLSVATGAMYQNKLIELAGGANTASGLDGTSWASVSYEQLLSWDPEVIILAGEAGYTVDDILNDANLSACTAVRTGNVYQFPAFAESLDSPVPAGVYGSLWLASILHPDLVSEADYLNSIRHFYNTYYGFDYTEN